MIETINTGNVRGIDRSHNLGRRTLICGPNGAGKSTIAISAYLALQGFVPGSDKKRAVANMPEGSDTVMAPEVWVDGKVVRRAWTRAGDKVSIRALVNGVEGDRNSAAGLVEAVFGPDPLLLDMETFWGLSPSEKRRIVLGLTCSPERQKELLQAEKTARDASNRAREDRHAAEKHLQETAKSLAATGSAAGKANPETIKAALDELVQSHEEIVGRIEKAKAGDKLRDQKAGIAERIENGRAKLDEVTGTLKTEKKARKLNKTKLSKMPAEPECPTVYMLDDEAREMLEEIQLLFDDLGPYIAEIKEDADLKVANAKREGIISRLNQLLPDPEECKKARDKHDAWKHKKDDLENAIAGSDKIIRSCETRIEAYQEAIDKLEAQAGELEDTAEPVDPNDETALEALKDKIAAGSDALENAASRKTLLDEGEKARLSMIEAQESEEKAKHTLSQAVMEQREMIESAAEMLGMRSQEMLPAGKLVIEDDDTDFRIRWEISEERTVDRTSLSGGERAIFDPAVGHALAPQACVVVEAAEVDPDNLETILKQLDECDFQIALMTCHAPKRAELPSTWDVISL